MRVAAFVVLVAALSTAACDREARSPGVVAGETFLTVNATGRADSRPDEARLQLGVQSLGSTASDASRTNREKMDKVTAALAKLGVKADQLQTPVARPVVQETTALGAAYLAGLAEGVWGDVDEVGRQWALDAEFVPRVTAGGADAKHAEWHRAVERSRVWA